MITLLASYIPAQRAARIDPPDLAALRLAEILATGKDGSDWVAWPAISAGEEPFPRHLADRKTDSSDRAGASWETHCQRGRRAEQRAQDSGSEVPECIREWDTSNGQGVEGTRSKCKAPGCVGAEKTRSGDSPKEQSNQHDGY